MAIRNIITKENPLLRKKSRKVEDFDARLATLIDDMIDTMYKAEGVGLAAVQVGILRRVVVIDCGDGLLELVNPSISSCVPSRSMISGFTSSRRPSPQSITTTRLRIPT